MRLTDFWGRMTEQFGSTYADSVAHDQVLPGLDGRTIHEALAEGWETKDVWRAVCEAFDVPRSLR